MGIKQKKTTLYLIQVFLSGCYLNSSIVKTSSLGNTKPCSLESAATEPCSVNGSGYVATDLSNSKDNISITTGFINSTTYSALIPNGWYENKSCQFSEPNLVPANIRSGISLFGVTGVAQGTFSSNINSNSLRNPSSPPIANNGDNQATSLPMTLLAESTTYAGQEFPTSNGFSFHKIPIRSKDDDGVLGTSCKYAVRPVANCGTTQSTLNDRIADCLDLNGICSDVSFTTKTTCEGASETWTSTSTWDGATVCNSGQGAWKLVTRSAANKEVWQDQRTGLLWSSLVSNQTNWCQASGNTQKAPLTYFQSYTNSLGTKIIGNGIISNVGGGSSSSDETITIQFTSATNFTVTGSTPSCDDSQSPIRTGSLTTIAGSNSVFSISNVCSFKITQGSINFVNGDTFILKSTYSAQFDCTAGGNANMITFLGSPLQPASPVSLCAEDPSLNPDNETWNNGGYSQSKGGLGKNSLPNVNWRLPTVRDYNLAELNGIRFVLPDMGIEGAQRHTPDSSPTRLSSLEWTSSVYAALRSYSWIFSNLDGNIGVNTRDYHNIGARCVGN